MDFPSKNHNSYTLPINIKKVVALWSFSLLVIFNLPNIRWVKEKYLEKDKIGKLPYYEHNIQQLFNQLWYNYYSHRLYINDETDIDLWHKKGAAQTMESLFNQFSKIHEGGETIISIPAIRTYYTYMGQKKTKTLCSLQINCNDIMNIKKSLSINDSELMISLSTLMHLWLTEYIEQQQAKDMSIEILTKSWNNRVDFRWNIAGIVEAIDNKWNITIDHVITLIHLLQQRYHTVDWKSTLIALSDEFNLWVDIRDIQKTKI